MDASAIALCRDNDVPIIVFNIQEDGNILRAALGHDVGTLICSDPGGA
jgi:uridylate kinase